MTVKNIESIKYCIYIDIDILPDNTIASHKILKYEMFVSNRQDFERKLLELFNVIHDLYRTILGHFTIYNSYDNRNGKNPVLASYDIQNNKSIKYISRLYTATINPNNTCIYSVKPTGMFHAEKCYKYKHV